MKNDGLKNEQDIIEMQLTTSFFIEKNTDK